MSGFIKLIPERGRQSKEPAVTIGKNIYLNKAAQAVANMHVMKTMEIFWDPEKKVLMLKPSHQDLGDAFTIRHPNPSTCAIKCPDPVGVLRGKAKRVCGPARWNEKDKAFLILGGELK